jgi:tocopherol cyclase
MLLSVLFVVLLACVEGGVIGGLQASSSARRLSLLAFAIPPSPPPSIDEGLHQTVANADSTTLSSGYVPQNCNNKDDGNTVATESYNTKDVNMLYLLDEKGRPMGIKDKLLLQTPHAGRKFRPTHPTSKSITAAATTSSRWSLRSIIRRRNNNRRFTEGWYYRLTLPEYNESFVFIFSIEDAGRFIGGGRNNNNNNKKQKSPLTLACMQMLGPQDTYLVQSDVDDTKFWAWKDAMALGCTFQFMNDYNSTNDDLCNIAAMTPAEWRNVVQSGFQVLPFHFQGRLNGHDGTLGGVKAYQGVEGMAEYDFDIRPIAGWGNYPTIPTSMTQSNDKNTTNNTNDMNLNQQYRNNHYRQVSTAGWLASFPVFEPHWQITMANARASGSINWNGTIYNFNDAPFYGEKNWGGAFPTKWFWTQCNRFDQYPDLAFTSGGGIRQLPFSFFGTKTETLGLIGIHYDGHFYEIVPWTGEMSWEVSPWGRWELRGRCTDTKKGTPFEAEIVAVTESSGVLLRAPTKDEGMQYFCRDSGFGSVILSLWEMRYDEDIGDFVRSRIIIDRARSSLCTVEVGGGPWWDVWKVKSKMSSTMRRIIRLPMLLNK